MSLRLMGRPRFSVSLFWLTWLALVSVQVLCALLLLAIIDHLNASTILLALVVAIMSGAAFAPLLTGPLRNLRRTIKHVQAGRDAALDEQVRIRELRDIHVGFNQMVRKWTSLEQSQAEMLAGISHDLRTPLARLRLEAEISVSDPESLQHMANDIEQLDRIINKFFDYARPLESQLAPVHLSSIIDQEVSAFDLDPDIQIKSTVPFEIAVVAEPVALGRVFANLLENARRYGVTPGTEQIDVRDHGVGVSEDKLSELSKPFYRDDQARTEANGAGLGLAIVEKTVGRLGGRFHLANVEGGGFVATLRFRSVPYSQSKSSPRLPMGA